MTRKQQAAAMRDAGASLSEIAAHFGWKPSSTRVQISQGRRQDYYNRQAAAWRRLTGRPHQKSEGGAA